MARRPLGRPSERRRGRQLQNALLGGDKETIDSIVDDVAHVLGKRQAEWWKIVKMGKLVEQDLNSYSDIK